MIEFTRWTLMLAVWAFTQHVDHKLDLDRAYADILALIDADRVVMRESGPWVVLFCDGVDQVRVGAERLTCALASPDPIREVLEGRVEPDDDD